MLDRAHREVKGPSVVAGKPGYQPRGRWELQAGEEVGDRPVRLYSRPHINEAALEYLSSSLVLRALE